jgi:predicted helicase
LHSPSYRETYKEFLKIDFPCIPYPTDTKIFWRLVTLGRQIREIHLLESPLVSQNSPAYPIVGNNIVDKLRFESGRVFINDTQYFDGVSETAWNFYIGGYQPAQKWLKDRKNKELSFEDIRHYQKIICALTETYHLMQEIDVILKL